ncbi:MULTISPECIES: GntR family transcriptional regulator [Brochothrix]|uniref:GntR family transcriptional regulator n=2 Tax=Brochothrix thermosphacta TaxID=2756 RepID=A0A1D2K9I9_BROTH|nr:MULTISPECIES: GntR family transcriptional regulator [Brochothrix]SLN04003.1 Transcriptional regulator, GntR family [Brachybacterium faecium]ANZ95413.1 hypothetical protein BFC19_08460 [Brochothrix thermosphacta]ANZ96315.1 hypothetical protein BFC20_00475 [Brochothrix thermosphacta]ATF25730.1 GntR family transcriptional regulator [Brochothrix thermosphacta]ATH85066.1 GntR family transcriptional regulator [Brochothrix thermosphacta]
MYQLDYKNNAPLFEQIIKKIKEYVVRGLLVPGDKIPSIREYAGLVGINPNTVSKAYQELERQQVIVTMKGKGAFIAEHSLNTVITIDEVAEKKRLENTLIDFIYSGIQVETMHQWIDDIYTKLKGANDNAN